STTTRPARVVIVACSSRPERESTWLSTETRIPMAAIRKIKSTSICFSPSQQQDGQHRPGRQAKGPVHPPLLFRLLPGLLQGPAQLRPGSGQGGALLLPVVPAQHVPQLLQGQQRRPGQPQGGVLHRLPPQLGEGPLPQLV